MANETGETYSEGTRNIVRDIGRRLTGATGDHRETFWFMQRLSLAVLLAFYIYKNFTHTEVILCAERERQRYF